ncbi:hypothetical protein CA13_27890 [Planctomycetes bacterium CA13]|uniref:Uncharacterized protein n=1 Tax=Novipirellula herctigrandis TaxID=2527986 RepID=A0A5C5Z311_9BACT|nr:hypothetical protein CA13_27890 [Planctomycetes bacterium CA13]
MICDAYMLRSLYFLTFDSNRRCFGSNPARALKRHASSKKYWDNTRPLESSKQCRKAIDDIECNLELKTEDLT